MTMKIVPNPTPLAEYLGIPVFIQLKVSILVASPAEKRAIPYSSIRDPQWVPRVLQHLARPTDPESPVMNAAVDVLEFAVLHATDDPKLFEVVWSVPSKNGLATVATLLPFDCIAQVTRVVSVPEESPIIKL